jgi:hypothetical protein
VNTNLLCPIRDLVGRFSGTQRAPGSKLIWNRFTFGLANAQWIFLNCGQQFYTWRKSLLAIFNWFMFVASAFLTVFVLYTSISPLNGRVQDPNDPLNVFTCADNSLF